MRAAVGRLSRAFTLLATLTGLATCVAESCATGHGRSLGYGLPVPLGLAPLRSQALVQATLAPPAMLQAIAILLPLTKLNAGTGRSMLKAAQLAMDQSSAPPLELAGFAFDATGRARLIATSNGRPGGALTLDAVDEVFVLQRVGHVCRSLAICEAERSSSHAAQVAPQDLSAPEV